MCYIFSCVFVGSKPKKCNLTELGLSTKLVKLVNKLGGHDAKLTIRQNLGYREVSEQRTDYGLGITGTHPTAGVPYLTKKKSL